MTPNLAGPIKCNRRKPPTSWAGLPLPCVVAPDGSVLPVGRYDPKKFHILVHGVR